MNTNPNRLFPFEDRAVPGMQQRIARQFYDRKEIFFQKPKWRPSGSQLPMSFYESGVSRFFFCLILICFCLMIGLPAGAFVWLSLVKFDAGLFWVYVFILTCCVAGIWAALWRWNVREKITISHDNVEFKTTVGLAESGWREPLANYKGVACFAWGYRHFLVTKQWEIILLHNRVDRTIPLFRLYDRNDAVQQTLEQICGVLRKPLVSVDEPAVPESKREFGNVFGLPDPSLFMVWAGRCVRVGVTVGAILLVLFCSKLVHDHSHQTREREQRAKDIHAYEMLTRQLRRHPTSYQGARNQAEKQLDRLKKEQEASD